MGFFEHHALITLVLLALFPRLTLLLGSFATGGLAWWLGWLVGPRILIAVLSAHYFDKNPWLVIWACFFAVAGTHLEAVITKHAVRWVWAEAVAQAEDHVRLVNLRRCQPRLRPIRNIEF